MHLLKAADHRRMPWKNGGGETIEIAVHPPGAGLSGFAWRVSMASVAADGPFSVFEGIDRTLALLSGEGMELEIEGMGSRFLTAASEPLRFPADAPTTARLTGGPITDLNVMTRRGAASHGLRRIAIEAEYLLVAQARWTLALPAGALTAEREEGPPLGLRRGDALMLVRGDPPVRLRAQAPTVLYLVTLESGPEKPAA
ncbi:HutD/Ves family protein [Aureimonas populi]|uniref:HutD family protein n=1 Tax=Aureimonas populi TaxID=1701758 RepID=A0ABW5CLB3_9HYPH|nr:HutD family protein [Aureimonas populi]